MPALAGQPSLHGNDACMVYWAEHYGETAGKSVVRPLFLLFGFSVESEFSGTVLGLDSLASLDWEGPSPWATSLPFSAFWT